MKRLTLAVLLGLSLSSFARSGIDIDVDGGRDRGDIALGDAVFGGTACNGQDAAKVFIEEGKLKVAFEDFGVQARFTRLERATCLFSIQAEWPAGKQIVIKNVKLKGAYAIGSGKAVATAELFTTGGVGQPVQAQATSGAGRFREVEPGEVYRSSCTGSGLLRLNSSIRLTGSGSMKLDRLSAELSLEDCP